MRKLFGNGRPIAAAILAVGVAAIAVPAFGDSAKRTQPAAPAGGFSAAGRPAAPGAMLPPPPPMTGAMRKRVEKTASCMQGKHVSSPSALRKAAKACGAPPPPPKGALLPPPMAAPGAHGKIPRGAVLCVHPGKRAKSGR
jgi:hypothetical protein